MDFFLFQPFKGRFTPSSPSAPRGRWRNWFGLGLGLAAALIAHAQEERERDLNLPITFGTQATTYPYSYGEADGILKGFAIDIAQAVARSAAVQVNLKTLPNEELGAALRAGTIDAIPFWTETKARFAFYDFSVPIVRLETALVVRSRDKNIRGPDDLRGSRIALGQAGTVGERYLLERLPDAVFVYTQNNEEMLRLVADGSCAAAVVAQLTAVSMIDQLGLSDELRVLRGVRGYDVRFCFAVRKGDALLLARFNEGLAVIRRTGEFEDIYDKWFGRYEWKAFTPLEIVSYVAAALALVCTGAMWGFFRQRILSRRIARQAAELAEQRSLLAALYDKHPLATVVLDVPENGAVVLISLNQEAARLFALDAAGAAGRPLNELTLAPDLRAYLDETVAHWRATKETARRERRLPTALRLLETTIVPLGLHEGRHRLCVLSADITNRRLMDEELAKSRRLRALGELVGGIAHEFNNLLTPIIATTSMLQLDQGSAKASAELGTIEQAAKRAAELTRRLLMFGRKFDEHPQPIQIADVVTNSQALLKTMIDRRIEWQLDVPADLPPLSSNSTDLNQVVFNLVLNARDTLMDKLARTTDPTWRPRLTLSAAQLPADAHPLRKAAPDRELSAWQRLTIEDNGQGIPPEIIERIFEPFFTTKEVGKGTGLSLSTIWHQVTEGGGDIVVTSKPGEGTAFHVFLPCWRSLPSADATRPARPPTAHPVPGARILVVDDEPMVARTVAGLLQRRGYDVGMQSDSVAACELIKKSSPAYDLVLLDLSMPRLSGVELIRQLRETAFAGRIMVMSGHVSAADATALETLKVDHVLAKPFASEQLATAVAKVLLAKPA